jgi:hypothetical protein
VNRDKKVTVVSEVSTISIATIVTMAKQIKREIMETDVVIMASWKLWQPCDDDIVNNDVIPEGHPPTSHMSHLSR